MPAASLMISAESLWANCGNNTRQEGVVRLWANRRPPGGNRGAQLPRWWIIFQPGFRLAVQKPASGKLAGQRTGVTRMCSLHPGNRRAERDGRQVPPCTFSTSEPTDITLTNNGVHLPHQLTCRYRHCASPV